MAQDLSQMSTEELLRLRQRAAGQQQPGAPQAPVRPTTAIPLPRSRQASTDETESQTNYRDNFQAPKTAADTDKTVLEADALRRQAERFGLSAEKYAEYRDNYLQLPLLQSRLGELRTRFNRDFQGVNPLEYGSIRSENTAFNDAAGNLRAPVAAALGLTGQQFNTPAEQEAFIGPMLPNANDRDDVIRSKLARLEEIFSNAFRVGQNYGFRYPTSVPMESSGWRFSPDQEQQALDFIRGEASPEDAARSILTLAAKAQGVEYNYTDADVANYAKEVIRVREELKRPGALLGGFKFQDPEPTQPQASNTPTVMGRLASGVGDIIEGAMGLPGMLNDAGNAALNMLGVPEMLGYAPNSLTTNTAGYVRELTGLPRTEGTIGEVNRAVASVLAPAGVIRTGVGLLDDGVNAVNRLVTQAPRTSGQAVNRSLAATPLTDAAVAASGATAADVVRQEGGGQLAQTTAALLAGVPAYGAARTARFATEPGGTGILAQEAKRENIPLLAADTGGTFGKSVTAGANLSPLAAGPLEDAAERGVAGVEGAVRRNADQGQGILSLVAAGDQVSNASTRLVSDTMQQAGQKLAVLENAAGGVRPVATNAMKLLEDRIDRLNAAPQVNAAEIAELTKYLDDLRPGVNISGLRDLKTNLRSGISFDGRVRGTAEKNFNKQLARALGQDIESGLAGNQQALTAYKDFNKFYEGRAGAMDAFASVIGKDRSGEQIVAAVRDMAGGRGNENTLATVVKNMTADEATGLRGTIIDGLGKPKPDAPFSLATFNRNWESMPKGAKKALFGDGDVLESLERIYRVSKQMDSTQRYASNPSGTARGMVGLTGPLVTAGPLLDYGADVLKGDGSGNFLIAAVASAALAGGQRAYGMVLANPKFATWLSRAPKTDDPMKLKNYIGRLATIATQVPAMADDIQALQSELERSVDGGQQPRRGVLAE